MINLHQGQSSYYEDKERCGWAEQEGFQSQFEEKEENVSQPAKLAITEEV